MTIIICVYVYNLFQNQEFVLLQQEKENIFKELKESRVEVANLVSRRDVLKKEIVRSRTLHSKEIHKLQTKLKGQLVLKKYNCFVKCMGMIGAPIIE